MTFTVLPDATPLADLLSGLDAADPFADPAFVWPAALDGEGRATLFDKAIWERRHVNWIRERLVAISGHLILVSDTLPPKVVSPDILLHQQHSRLKYGRFDPLDYRLADLQAYQGASIFVPDEFATEVLKSFPHSVRGGRPDHPAKAWYAARGFKRKGKSLKEIQREMMQACGSAPTESTIRAWEKEALVEE